jgi:hypothetical protein
MNVGVRDEEELLGYKRCFDLEGLGEYNLFCITKYRRQ